MKSSSLYYSSQSYRAFRRSALVSSTALALFSGSAAFAGDAAWNVNANGAWGNSTLWNPASSPGATSGTTNTDTASFDSTSLTGTRTVTVDTYRNLQNLNFNITNSQTFQLQTGTLVLTAGGKIDVTGSGTGGVIMNAPVSLLGNYTINDSSTTARFQSNIAGATISGAAGVGNLTLNLGGTFVTQGGANASLLAGTISNGTGNVLSIVKTGVGTWQLNGNSSNSFTGGVTVKQGQLGYGQNNAFGTGTVTLGDTSGSVDANVSFGSSTTMANAVNVIAGSSGTLSFLRGGGSGPSTTTGLITLGNNLTISQNAANAQAFNIQSGITGTGNVSVKALQGTGTTTLSGASINFSGLLSNDGVSASPTVISGAIGSNVTSVTQNSPISLLTLSNGGNAYTGGTTINRGTLLLSGAINLPSTGALQVNSGGSFSLADGTARTTTTTASLGLANGANLAFDWNAGALDQLTSTAAATTTGNVGIIIRNTSPTGSGGTLISSASGGLTTTNGTKYFLANNTNFTAPALTVSDTTVSIGTQTAATALTNAYWLGGQVTGALGTMAFSSGTTSNWASAAAGTAAGGVVPGGSAVNIIFGATGSAQQANVVAGADMNLGSITFNDTASVTIAGNNAITLNSTSATAASTTAALATVTAGSAISVTSFANASNTISANVNLSANQTWDIANGKTLTVSGGVFGSNTLAKTNTGTLVLSGTNGNAGAITIGAGTLQLGNGGTTGSLSPTATIVNNGTFTINRSNAVVQGTDFSSAGISGNGSFVQAGTGTTTLNAANTYTGGTTISSGTLQLGAGDTTGSLSATGSIVNNGTFTINRSNAVAQGTNFSSAGISGNGSFVQAGTGTTTLNAANTYTGGTAVNAGRLISTLATAGGSTAVASGATLEYSIASSATQGASAYTGAGTIQKTGNGTLTLGTTASSVALSAGGLIDVQGGTFAIDGNNAANFGSNLGDMNIASGATFEARSALVKVDKLTGTGTYQSGWFGARSITVGVNNGSSTFAGTLQGNGAGGANGSTPLIKTGNGTFSLTGTVNINNNSNDSNAGDDVLRVTGGTSGSPSTLTLSPTGTSVIGSTSTKNIVSIAPSQSDVAILNQTAGTINSTSISIGNTGVGTYNLSGGTTNANNVQLAFTGPTSGTGEAKLNVSGAAALNVLNNGSIVMGTFYGRKATVVQTGGTVALYSNAGTTLGGNGSLAFNGGGTASSYTLSGGTLSIPAITLLAAGGGAGGGTGALNLDGGTLKITSSSFSVPAGVTINVKGDGAVANSGANIDTGSLAVTINAPLVHSGPNAIDGGLTKLGTGTLSLGGNNTYTGPTTVTNGTLEISGTGSINASSGITVSGGVFKNNSSVGITAPFTFTGGTIGGTNLSGISITIGTGQKLSPGNSPGLLTTGDQTWDGDGSYDFEINNATGMQDTNWDRTLIVGTLTLGTVSNATPFTINLISLNGLVAGQAANFNDALDQSWVFATATSIAGTAFAADQFVVNTTSFQNAFTGSFGVTKAGNELLITYTAIPEPSTCAMLAGVATLGLAAYRRRRQQKVAA